MTARLLILASLLLTALAPIAAHAERQLVFDGAVVVIPSDAELEARTERCTRLEPVQQPDCRKQSQRLHAAWNQAHNAMLVAKGGKLFGKVSETEHNEDMANARARLKFVNESEARTQVKWPEIYRP